MFDFISTNLENLILVLGLAIMLAKSVLPVLRVLARFTKTDKDDLLLMEAAEHLSNAERMLRGTKYHPTAKGGK